MRKVEWEKYSSKKESDEDDEDDEKNSALKTLLERNLKFVEDDYNLWILHTNFLIMEVDIENIASILGVECLDIFSPYRLRVGIGKLFEEEKIKNDISFVLNSSESLQLLTDDVKKQVEEILETFKDKKYWALLILPNGKIVTYVGKDEKDLNDKLEFFEKVQEATSCQLLTS